MNPYEVSNGYFRAKAHQSQGIIWDHVIRVTIQSEAEEGMAGGSV
jgi:hypothetical protein